jgi:hypothetical protein
VLGLGAGAGAGVKGKDKGLKKIAFLSLLFLLYFS